MQASEFIDATVKRYNKVSLWIIAGLALVTLVVMSITESTLLLNSLIVTVIYSLIICNIYGLAWKGMAKSSPTSLTKFYLVAAAIRIMTAVAVAIVYCLMAKDRGEILRFVSVFLIFYVAILVFDGIFFARVEKNKI